MYRPIPYTKTKQKGVVLVVALIVLVAMTLAGLALMRSVDTSNIIAGNLAFHQSASYSGASGTEAAISWLQTNNTGTTLQASVTAQGYSAFRQDPGANQTWDAFWTAVLAAQASAPVVDAAGNTVTYAIQRMCNMAGSPTSPGIGCSRPFSAAVSSSANSKQTSNIPLSVNNQIYYRITTRVAGPRNTVSFIQTIVAL